MKKFSCSLLIVLFACMLISCAQTSSLLTNSSALIQPGDKVGDLLFTAGKEGDSIYAWSLGCDKQGTEEKYICKSTVGTKVNVSAGVYADPSGKDLDALWSEHTYKMFINDRLVNLQAFGSIDVLHPRYGKMRHWNVVIAASKPAEITVRDSGVVRGKSFEETTIYVFKAP